MPSRRSDGQFIIAAGEIADFTVCPRAWIFKYRQQQEAQEEQRSLLSTAGIISHRFWVERIDDLLTLAWRTKFVIGLTVVVLFVWELTRRVQEAEHTPSSVLLSRTGSVLILLLCLLVVLGFMSSALLKRRKEVGVGNESAVRAIDGSESKETREYLSETLLLAGRPDGVILEQNMEIPVEYKPHSKKLRDRFVAQLLVYMRLIEEQTGKRPTHGYVVLGSNARRVRVENSLQRQEWLDRELSVMRRVLAETEPPPARPHPAKCARCAFRSICTDAAVSPGEAQSPKQQASEDEIIVEN